MRSRGEVKTGTIVGVFVIIVLVLAVISAFLPMVTVMNGHGRPKMKCQKNMGTLGQLLAHVTDTTKLPGEGSTGEQFWIDLVFTNLHEAPGILICPAIGKYILET